MKKNLITYTHAPATSPGVQGLHIMLFKILECFERDYNIFVLCRTKECYNYYKSTFGINARHITLIDVPDNMTDSEYTFGLMEENIRKKVDHIDKVFWFWPGMKIVTPEERIKEVYDGLCSNELIGKTISIKDRIDGSVVQQAEMLYTILKDRPRFIYRVGDYTEPHIENIIDYPMRLVSYYPSKERGHEKIHDAEWLHFSDKIPQAPKLYDFIFGYTVEIPERAYLSDFCFTHIKQNDKFKLYVKDKHFSKYAPINTQLESDKYFNMLRYAKFSLIAPSTDPDEVSVNRVYEDIARRCIPIFMKTVKYWKAFDEEMNEFIKNNLVYDEDIYPCFNDFIASLNYEKLYADLMECKLLKSFQNREYLYNMILEETE